MVDVVECVRADVVNLVDAEETYNEEYEVDLLGNLFQHLFPQSHSTIYIHYHV